MFLKNKVMFVVLCSAMSGSAQAGVVDVARNYLKPTVALSAGAFSLYNVWNARFFVSDWHKKQAAAKAESEEQEVTIDSPIVLKVVELNDKYKKNFKPIVFALISALVCYKLDGHGTVLRGLSSGKALLLSLFAASSAGDVAGADVPAEIEMVDVATTADGATDAVASNAAETSVIDAPASEAVVGDTGEGVGQNVETDPNSL